MTQSVLKLSVLNLSVSILKLNKYPRDYIDLPLNLTNVNLNKFNLLISGTEELDEMKKTRKLQLPKSELHKESKKKKPRKDTLSLI